MRRSKRCRGDCGVQLMVSWLGGARSDLEKGGGDVIRREEGVSGGPWWLQRDGAPSKKMGCFCFVYKV
ncbi:hypothetical protein JHK85_051045 [Glycine max]|uniref:Uncharacterized protein n=1 Tax=Glycine soja TaxID=3848 RepID=A0A0B2Q368_GLYSO|nr:hypothetical protein JHK87_050101 [Glycine soja]KAG4936126.1 hypothetical protein JHK85_051045 [Glycine max]KHN14428.1 hypothetical protein glysoja_041298 [Glycine soja]